MAPLAWYAYSVKWMALVAAVLVVGCSSSAGEPLAPELYDGELLAAWNAGNLETYRSYFADDAEWFGFPLSSRYAQAMLEGYQAYGVRWVAAECDDTVPQLVRCRVIVRDDLHEPAGLRAEGSEHYWLNEADEIQRLESYYDLIPLYRFDADFGGWIAANRPDVARLLPDGNMVATASENVPAVLDVLDEYLAESDEYPIAPAGPIPEPSLTGSVAVKRGEAIEIHNGSSGQAALVEWGVSRFERGGLEVPRLDAVIFPPTEVCQLGHSGAASTADGATVAVCWSEAEICATQSCSAFTLPARRTILHELAHVWIDALVQDDTRERCVELRGLERWSGDVPWQERGIEHAAEIVLWGLIDRPVPLRVALQGCEELTVAFRLLTGVDPRARLPDC